MKRTTTVLTCVSAALLVWGAAARATAAFIESFESYTNNADLTAQGWTGFGGSSAEPKSVLGQGHDGVTQTGLSGTGAYFTSGINVGAFKQHGQAFSSGDTIILTADVKVVSEALGFAGVGSVVRVGLTNAANAASSANFYDLILVNKSDGLYRLASEQNASDSSGGAGYTADNQDSSTAGGAGWEIGDWLQIKLSHIVGGSTTAEVRNYSNLSNAIYSKTTTHNWGAIGDNFDSVFVWGWQSGAVDNISVTVSPVPEPTSLAIAGIGAVAVLCARRRRAS